MPECAVQGAEEMKMRELGALKRQHEWASELREDLGRSLNRLVADLGNEIGDPTAIEPGVWEGVYCVAHDG